MPRPSLFMSVLLSLSLAAPVPALAYGGGGGNNAAGLNNATTSKTIRTLKRGVRGCQRLQPVYRYDCYRQTYAKAASQLTQDPAYAEIRTVLLDVENRLGRTINANLDKAAPQVRRGGSQFRAIRQASLPRAKSEFSAALERAETTLLRSPNGSNTHVVRIADALNSNKLLLRSRLKTIQPPAFA
ncbi:MAG: hypothetical protein AB8B51_15835 [Sedimentitalea sp.]